MGEVEVDDSILRKLKGRAEEKGYDSVEDYVRAVLKQVVKKLEKEEKSYSEKDEKKVRDRLRSLGYMD